MIDVRRHGERGPVVVALHGGPGAPGEMAPLAQALAGQFRVVEPLQRRAGLAPLTVARHVADLHEVVESVSDGGQPALLGFSWGAMLALAYAAEHPRAVSRLVLVGCGTFDRIARAELVRRRAERGGEDGFDVDPSLDVAVDVDERGGAESWADMLRLQADGTYPARFARIQVPVAMIHGVADPHPGPTIRDGLRPHVRNLLYVEVPRCGHKPWIERQAREPFLRVLLWVLGR